MKTLRIKLLSLFVITISLLGLSSTSCTNRNKDIDRNIFRYAISDDVKSWDPAIAYDQISLDIVPSIFETLYQFDYLQETYKIIPLLASDYPKISKDKLTVTIPIRQDVYFQDDPAFTETKAKGRLLKASDFVYALNRLMDPKTQSTGKWIFENRLKEVKAIKDDLLQIKLTKPYPQLLDILCMSFTAPVAKEVIEKYGDSFGQVNENPVGTGPYVLKSWKRNNEIRLIQNKNYHSDFYPTKASVEYVKQGLLSDAGKVLPFIEEISIQVFKEEQPAWLSFLSGSLDMASIPRDILSQVILKKTNLSPDLLSQGKRLHVSSGITFYFLAFNQRDSLMQNKFLRQAISSAVHRDPWIDLMTGGTGQQMTHVLPIGLPGRPLHEDLKIKYDYDLTRAKKLLAKAGYPEGKGLPTLTLDLRGSDSTARRLGDFFSRELSAIGIKLNVVLNTFPAYLEKIRKGETQMSYGGWMLDFPDPENVLQLLYGPNRSPGPNEANYDNSTYNKLYEKMAILEPGESRSKLIGQMNSHIQEEVPWAYGFYLTAYRVTQPWIKNARFSELILNKYKYFKIDTQIKNRYLKK